VVDADLGHRLVEQNTVQPDVLARLEKHVLALEALQPGQPGGKRRLGRQALLFDEDGNPPRARSRRKSQIS
jgi:hypothetical protein